MRNLSMPRHAGAVKGIVLDLAGGVGRCYAGVSRHDERGGRSKRDLGDGRADIPSIWSGR